MKTSKVKQSSGQPKDSSASSLKPKTFFQKLGPGLITGASDDDPSGIGTYSQVGARFGFGMLWVMLFSYPLMSIIQEISARVGRVTGLGIAGNLRRHYPKPILYAMVLLLLIANVFNLGADVGAMGAAAKLLLPGPLWAYIVMFGILSLFLQIFIPYTKYVSYLKWLTVALFAYIATAIMMGQPDWEAIRATFLPAISLRADYLTALVAVFGTTISPYLFFWQASEEAQDVGVDTGEKPLKQSPRQAPANFKRIRTDTYLGMAFSNLVAFFIILTAASTLHAHGVLNIDTADQAAQALRPLAGRFSFLLFTLGIIGTGLLAVPVLAGSAAYAVSEVFKWENSLEDRPEKAPKFYATIAVAVLAGLLLNFVGINPIKALFLSALLNGIVAVPVMVMMMILTHNRKIMGRFTLPLYLWVGGWIATAVMFIAALGMFAALRFN